ncbi:hypothetical protein Corgl_1474 [Coriobacterium glomerans PW2]|uniref:Uncharacterized protein n=1 Tax=Coriobacterium glomerans (strain ATCC 49209 / DSM 20642 / JCM 10262 / PW2) TaxID=700015 RepID=F2N8X4_CORGP|nr:hypothetical protein [Coriobacterium glomerans]AEB07574.1 hypothetical protein Corgl_1474 [Coriobacterium glomerans PW2]
MGIMPIQSEGSEELQRFVDALFRGRTTVELLDIALEAEVLDLTVDAREIVSLLPPGTYERQRLCDQLNSATAAHGWSALFGTVE